VNLHRGLLPDVLAPSKPLKRLGDLLVNLHMGLLPDVLAPSKPLKRLGDLLRLANRSARELGKDILLFRGRVKEFHQVLGDLLFQRCRSIGVKDRAGASIVSLAVAVRANHRLRVFESV